ncbi:MAG: AEC family transporter [Methanobacteriota archaeon]
MDLFLITFQSVIVLLALGALGFLIIQRKIIPEQALGVLSPLALEIALPCLIFSNIITTFSPENSPDWWLLPGWWLVFTVYALVFTLGARYLSAKGTRREFAVSLFYQNALFFPIAILTGMFGGNSPYLVSLFLFALFFAPFLFNSYYFFFGKSLKEIQWRKIVHPVLVATLVAVGFRLVGAQVLIPDFALSFFQLVGAMTVPLIMLYLGGSMYADFRRREKIQRLEIVKFVVMKNVMLPVVFLGVLLVVRPGYMVALLLMLQSVVPPVTAIPLLVGRVDGNQAIVNQFVVTSFLCSLITIPVFLGVFSVFFS